MADITPTDVAEAVAKQIPAFFNDAFEQFRQGEGGYLATGEPEGVIAQVGQAVGRSYCRIYGAGAAPISGERATRTERACRPYLDTLDPGAGLGIATPFEGGQCDGLAYLVTLNWFVPGGTPENQTTGFVARGPIRGVSLVEVAGGRRVRVTARSNPQLSFTCTTPQPLGPSTTYTLGAPAIDAAAEQLTVSITPCGFTDICGSPPPEVVDPRPIADPNPPPFRFNPPGLPPIDIPVNIDFNPDGTINVDFGGEPVTVDPFPPDDTGGGGGGGDPGDPTDPGSPGGSGDTGDGGSEEGEAGPEEELVGLLVEVLDSPESANRFDNNPAQPFRGIGYVRMGYPGRLGVDISGGTVISPQFFHAQQRGLTDWRVDANVGFNLRVTPYYRNLEE